MAERKRKFIRENDANSKFIMRFNIEVHYQSDKLVKFAVVLSHLRQCGVDSAKNFHDSTYSAAEYKEVKTFSMRMERNGFGGFILITVRHAASFRSAFPLINCLRIDFAFNLADSLFAFILCIRIFANLASS